MSEHNFRTSTVASFPPELATTVGEDHPVMGQLLLTRDYLDARSITTVSREYPTELIQAPPVANRIARLKVLSSKSHNIYRETQKLARFKRVSAELLLGLGVPTNHIVLPGAFSALHAPHYKSQLKWMLDMPERTDGAWGVRMVHPDAAVPTDPKELTQHNFSVVDVARSTSANGIAAYVDATPVVLSPRKKLIGFGENGERYNTAGIPQAIERHQQVSRLGDLAMSQSDTMTYMKELLANASRRATR
ncbi:MAG TPA: hypothetical protein VLF43_03040 [Candidatus Saccharimonadales bacterium]|nr:hypothetical protein [Candidatus Saccharimonadales bacterium]